MYFFKVAWLPPADRRPSRTSASEYEYDAATAARVASSL
jgi:hypothetical protein